MIRDSSDDQLIAKKEPVPIGIDICKEEEPIIKEKPKEEILPEERIEEKLPEEGIPEERLPEEKIIPEERLPEKEIISEERIIPEEKLPEEIPKERILEERMPEEKILEEKEKEKIDEIIIEKKDKSVQTDDDIDESSSESIYSYSMYSNYVFLHYIYSYYQKNTCLFQIYNLSHDLESRLEIKMIKIIIDTCFSLSRKIITRDRN